MADMFDVPMFIGDNEYNQSTMEVQVTKYTVIDANRMCLSIAEAALKVGVSRPFLRLEIARGRLKTAKVGRRVLIPVESLQNWLNAAMKSNADS
jgi:excisionase family DNA binding protein